MAAADVDADGKDDLAVGAPGENRNAGRVTLLYGARRLGSSDRDRTIHEDTRGIPGTSEAGDFLGARVSLLDLDGNRRPDLITGIPFEGHPRPPGAILYVPASENGRLAADEATSRTPEQVGISTDGGMMLRFGHEIGRQ